MGCRSFVREEMDNGVLGMEFMLSWADLQKDGFMIGGDGTVFPEFFLYLLTKDLREKYLLEPSKTPKYKYMIEHTTSNLV